MGAATLDVASYTIAGLEAVIEMAEALADEEAAIWATGRLAELRAAFERDWWIDEESLYADSLCGRSDVASAKPECHRPGDRILQRHWIGAVPMEMGIAADDHATRALSVMCGPAFTGEYGLFHSGRKTEGDELAVWTLPNSVIATGLARYGRVDEALDYVRAIARLLDLEMPGALPEIAPSPAYDPLQPLTTRAMFMQAWSAYGIQWPIIRWFLGIEPDAPARKLRVVPQLPATWPHASVDNLRVGGETLAVHAKRMDDQFQVSVKAPPGWDVAIGCVVPLGSRVAGVRLDGASIPFAEERTRRGLEVTVAVPPPIGVTCFEARITPPTETSPSSTTT